MYKDFKILPQLVSGTHNRIFFKFEDFLGLKVFLE